MIQLKSSAEFRSLLLQDIYRSHYQSIDNNFDHFRFGFDVNPNVVYMDSHSAYLDYVLANLDEFFAAFLSFDDQVSRELFMKLVTFRCVGSPHLRIWDDIDWNSVQEMYDRAAQYETGPSVLDFEGLFGPLQHFENVPTGRDPIALDAWRGNIAYGFEGISGGGLRHRQYFFERDGVRVQPEAGDWVVDGGACFGDTGVFFASSVGIAGRVFCFEPLPVHFGVIALNIKQNGLENRMFCIPKGLGSETNDVSEIEPSLAQLTDPGFSLLRGNNVPVVTIDDFADLREVEKIDFIKLDVEGFELATLRGASRSIGRFRPKLAISLYHKWQDFFEIPIFLRAHYPFYRLHLDHHTIFHEETVLYAIAD